MLKNLKLMLGIDDNDRDALLKLIIDNITARLALMLGGVDEIPEELEHIVLEVAIIRFNRIGSEGLSGHSVEGETMNFIEDDFSQFSDEIQAFLDSQKGSTRGKVRFL